MPRRSAGEDAEEAEESGVGASRRPPASTAVAPAGLDGRRRPSAEARGACGHGRRSGRPRRAVGPWSPHDQLHGNVPLSSACGPPGRPAGPPCPVRPNSSACSRTVVSSGSRAVARARSSKPVTETSSGTRSPSRRAALYAPAASMSSSQTSAVGRGPGSVSAPVGGVPVRPSMEIGAAAGAHEDVPGVAPTRAAQCAGADVEGPGGDVGGEVQEAAVPEAEQVVGDLAHAVGDVEVDGGGAQAALRVAVEHHQGQLVAADARSGRRRPWRRRSRRRGRPGRRRRGRGRGRRLRGRGRGPRRSRVARRRGRRLCRRRRRTRVVRAGTTSRTVRVRPRRRLRAARLGR